jgi:hypothetical protein
MKKITLLAGLVALATELLADLAFAEHSPEHLQGAAMAPHMRTFRNPRAAILA